MGWRISKISTSREYSLREEIRGDQYALVNKSGIVVNIIIWGGDSVDFGKLSPVASDVAQIDWIFDGKTFSNPEGLTNEID